jgi:hypothetical protein
VPLHKKGDKTDCSNCQGISLLSTIYRVLYNILLSMLTPYVDHQCRCRHNHQLLIRYCAFVRYWIINWRTKNRIICRLLERLLFSKEESLFKFGTLMKQVRLSKMSLNETYIKLRKGKHLSHVFPIQYGLK